MNNDVPLHTFHMARSACTAAPKAAIIALAQVARSSVWCHYGHCGHCDKTWWNPLTISDRTKKDCGSMFKIEMQDWLRPWLLGHAWSLRLSSFWSLPWGGGVKAIQRLDQHPLKKLGKIEHFPTNKDCILNPSCLCADVFCAWTRTIEESWRIYCKSKSRGPHLPLCKSRLGPWQHKSANRCHTTRKDQKSNAC